MESGDAIARAALAAELHVQIEVDCVSVPESTPGTATVQGTIVKVFRGGSTRIGQWVRFGLPCYRETDRDVIFYTTVWRVATLETARVLEVYLHPINNEYAVHSSLCRELDAVTDTPSMTFTEADAKAPNLKISEMLWLAAATGVLGLMAAAVIGLVSAALYLVLSALVRSAIGAIDLGLATSRVLKLQAQR